MLTRDFRPAEERTRHSLKPLFIQFFLPTPRAIARLDIRLRRAALYPAELTDRRAGVSRPEACRKMQNGAPRDAEPRPAKREVQRPQVRTLPQSIWTKFELLYFPTPPAEQALAARKI